MNDMVLKSKIRDVAGKFLYFTGILSPKKRAKGRLSIVTFHRILPKKILDSYPFPGLAVTPEDFEFLLDFFVENYLCFPLSEAIEKWKKEETDKPILSITFDDGQMDNYKYAWPIMKKNRVRGTFFATVPEDPKNTLLWHDIIGYGIKRLFEKKGKDFLEGFLRSFGFDCKDCNDYKHIAYRSVQLSKNLNPEERRLFLEGIKKEVGSSLLNPWDGIMGREELITLDLEGNEIGSHTLSHTLLDQIERKELEEEIRGSKEKLEKMINKRVNTFCYPNGNYNDVVVEIVRKAGYKYAVTTDWGNNQRDCNLFLLRRFDINIKNILDSHNKISIYRLLWRMSGVYPGFRFK